MEKGQGKGTDTLQTDNVFTRKEYIERKAAKKKLVAFYKAYDTDGNYERKLALLEIDLALRAIPAADVAPVRHGRWLEHHTWAKCSECGYLIGFETTYCPNCGARMDGE